MTELAVRDEAITLIHPQTGEVLDLRDAEAGQIARWIDSVRDWEANARQAKQLASEELHRRMDAQAKWTLRDGEYEIRGESPERVDYDTDALVAALKGLVQDASITAEAAESAVRREVVLKPSKRGINALLKLGGKVAEAVRSCEREVARPRRISLSRKAI